MVTHGISSFALLRCPTIGTKPRDGHSHAADTVRQARRGFHTVRAALRRWERGSRVCDRFTRMDDSQVFSGRVDGSSADGRSRDDYFFTYRYSVTPNLVTANENVPRSWAPLTVRVAH